MSSTTLTLNPLKCKCSCVGDESTAGLGASIRLVFRINGIKLRFKLFVLEISEVLAFVFLANVGNF